MTRLFALSLAAACLASGPVAAAGDPDRGEQLYQACTDCHSLDKNDVGPRHRGVFGRKAASSAGLPLFRCAQIGQYRLE